MPGVNIESGYPPFKSRGCRIQNQDFSPASGPDPLWVEALERGAAVLPESDPFSLLYYEDRADLRIEMVGGGPPRAVETRNRGLSVRFGQTLVHGSDPSLEDAACLPQQLRAGRLSVTSASGARPELPATVIPEAPAAVPWIRELAERIGRAGGCGEISASLSWIASSQRVLVARPGRKVAWDQRRSGRLRVAIRVEREGRVGVAVEDWVGQPGAIESAERAARRAVDRAFRRLEARSVFPGEGPVVFAPGVGGILIHETVGHALEADTVLGGGSRLASLVAPVTPGGITVVDDPRRGRAPWRIDDEGEEPKPVPLLRDGRVGGLLHDQHSARISGTLPSGHGRRSSYQDPVRPRMGCTFLVPGEEDPEEILRRTRSGVYVRRMEAAGTDPRSGVALFRVSDADRIVSGKQTVPLHPFVLRLTLEQSLMGIDAVGHDLEFDRCIGACVRDGQALATSVGAPTCRIAVATVFSARNRGKSRA